MSYHAGTYDCIVVGAGHAGCEAALAAARMGARTLIFTVNMENIAQMACNPSIGGPAKGHLVREIDALGGEMGLNIDESHLQMRMLNTGKGPAVHALRAQADKSRYQKRMMATLQAQENLALKQALVDRIILGPQGEIAGIETENGALYECKTLILCTGTYLRGRLIIGDLQYPGGPNGQRAPSKLSASLREAGIELGRFKTGTPARVDRRTIDFRQMSEQRGDADGKRFSFLTKGGQGPNIPCYLAHTNLETHQTIRSNIHLSPLFSGQIEGVGPRYCPSIEDKVMRFAERERHQLFLEPEGLDTYEIYVQGMSSSLPEEVQLQFLRTIKGMEQAEMMRVGYAIEYDYVIPTQLSQSLENKQISGLFCAGQVNGTSGYEEAAAQGLVAGINAALKLRGEKPFVLKRSEAYIGVLIDDLVTKGTNEPYRIMTSRAEYRLLLRQDNADLRLTEKGYQIGLVTKERYAAYVQKKTLLNEKLLQLQNTVVSPADARVAAMLEEKNSSPLRQSLSWADLLRRAEICYNDFVKAGLQDEVPAAVSEQIDIQLKYAGYIEKQLAQVERFERMENKALPQDFDYTEIKGISGEAQQKLNRLRPSSLGQASRISGVSPADISVLLVYLEQRRRKGSHHE